ncbi:MAG: hypothetical protein ACRDBG_17095 [Waterburya sp.]
MWNDDYSDIKLTPTKKASQAPATNKSVNYKPAIKVVKPLHKYKSTDYTFVDYILSFILMATVVTGCDAIDGSYDGHTMFTSTDTTTYQIH